MPDDIYEDYLVVWIDHFCGTFVYKTRACSEDNAIKSFWAYFRREGKLHLYENRGRVGAMVMNNIKSIPER